MLVCPCVSINNSAFHTKLTVTHTILTDILSTIPSVTVNAVTGLDRHKSHKV